LSFVDFRSWHQTDIAVVSVNVRFREYGGSLHVAMNSLVKPDADFFLETQIA
jgi:hypothetical protein